jgi:hypothetical protein
MDLSIARGSFAETIRHMTFHPNDVEVFGYVEAVETLGEILGEFGWEPLDNQTLQAPAGLGDWRVWIAQFGVIEVTDDHDNAAMFTGEWRVIVPRVLAYLCSTLYS